MVANMGFPSNGEANQGWKLYFTSLIGILCAGLIVIARIVTRFRDGRLGADDYTIMVSLAFSIVLSVTIQLAVVHGYGQHKNDLSTERLHACLKFFWIAQIPYNIVVCLNKSSVILLYMRIFVSRHFRWLCYGALALVIGSGTATVFATIFQCMPIEHSWNETIDGTCIDRSDFWIAIAVLNITTDVVVLTLPSREIFRLPLEFKERMMVYGVVLLGGFVTITSILRVAAVTNSAYNQQDQTWNYIPRGCWTLLEANLGIICACLAALKQLVKRWFLFMSSVSSASKSGPVGEYRYGYGGSGVADHASGSTKGGPPTFGNRQHTDFDKTTDDENICTQIYADGRKSGKNVWTGFKSYQLTSFTYRDTSDDRRKSDEKDIMSAERTERDHSPNNVENEDILRAWPLGRTSGITRKVDIQVNAQPRQPIDE